jgi:UDP-N-acetylmuramate dehydrogenase
MSIEIRENVPLAPLTTFKIGGNARYFIDASNVEDVRDAIKWAKEKSTRFVVLAGGSNVLIADEGFDGLIIRMAGTSFEFTKDGPSSGDERRTVLRTDAGANLLSLIHVASKRGFGGWEKLAGIPGSIGGAVRGNAGAFGSEIKDFVVTVDALNVETGETRKFSNAECDFSYRHSFFKDHSEWIIFSAVIDLVSVDPTESAKLANETIAEREKRHLQNVQAAGSFFMNPVTPQNVIAMFEREKGVKSREGRVPAGWLIEKAGMKGASVGGAKASEQHPNYLVNTGNATANDVRELAEKIKEAVKSTFSITLQEEAALL